LGDGYELEAAWRSRRSRPGASNAAERREQRVEGNNGGPHLEEKGSPQATPGDHGPASEERKWAGPKKQ
jgi:hypothetical protein